MRRHLLTFAILASTFAFAGLIVNANGKEDTYLSKDIVSACEECGEAWGICPELLEALVEVESSGSMQAQNGTCYGVCQINSAVWGGDYDTVYKQIDKACEILLEYADEHCGDIRCALMKYNGEPNAELLCEQGKSTEYANKILQRAEELERVHGK